MKELRISIEKDCKILSSQSLMVKAMQALPVDSKIVKMKCDEDGGYIDIKTELEPQSFGKHFRITETVELSENKR